MTPAVKAFVDSLIDHIQVMTAKVQSLTAQVQSLTDQLQKRNPRNSSLPPSTEHPHAKPKRKPLPGK